MLISYNWLKKFVEINDSPEELAERLTMAGLEVESITSLEAGLEDLVVGKIQSKDPVPNSDHLTECQVDVGRETLQIVCGAPNHRAGDKVIVALPGANLPNGMKIKKSKIRGVESSGMICSEKELGISDEAAGVMILSEEVPVGEPASQVLGREDTILEIDLTPNRADALSHLGVGREVAALTEGKFEFKNPEIEESGPDVNALASVEILDPDLCPRYIGRVIRDVTIAPSPLWLQMRLRSLGFRPINNVVDVTNYVLMELGHPLHAFDYDLINEHKIIVRRALKGEKIRTLDGIKRGLDPAMLVICDPEAPVAVAGVMGGESSEVHSETRHVFLEAAFFQPVSIRKTAKELGLHSESSHRFERGTDIEGMVYAIDRAASMIRELAGGEIAKGRVDQYPERPSPIEISLRFDRVRSLMGVNISSDDIVRIFKRLSLKVLEETAEKAVVRVPSFRHDLVREIDLIEEVVRIYGYNRIPSTLPTASLSSGEMTTEQRLTSLARQILVKLGYHETIHYSFHNPEDLNDLDLPEQDPLRTQIRIRNPLSEDQRVLRSTLIPGLLHTLRQNLKHSLSDIRIFEIGRVFEPRGSGLPLEKNRLSGLISGKDRPVGWGAPQRDVDFFDIKGDLEELLHMIGLDELSFIPLETPSFLHPGKSAWIEYDNSRLGFLGELHPTVLKRSGISGNAEYFELDFDLCIERRTEKDFYHQISRYPSVERDIALILPETTPAGEVEKVIQGVEPQLVRDIRLFDVYRGEPVPADRKSLAFSIRFQALDRTLTDQEINRIRDKIVVKLNKVFGATLRE